VPVHTCPECGHRFREDAAFDQQVAALVVEWEQHCATRGHLMPCGRVNESVAAELLGQRKEFLSKLRRSGKGPPIIRAPADRGHFSYDMRELADWWLRRNMEEPGL
jgi:hypothetical protein